MKADLVIFDMDGTLIDSETLAERVVAETTKSLNQELSVEEVSRRFRGRTIDYMIEELTALHGGPLPASYLPGLDRAYREACATELKATDGAEEAIKKILPTPICVASNGEPSTIRASLEFVGLLHYFPESVFSAREVAAPKPAPDVFLHAAREMGAAPDRVVVIEDSPLGIEAGLAAGMNVIGFVGNHPEMTETLAAFDVPVLSDMRALPQMISDLP